MTYTTDDMRDAEWDYDRDPLEDRIMPAGSAVAVGRFRRGRPVRYHAATMPDAPLRDTRAEAVADEYAYLEGRRGR